MQAKAKAHVKHAPVMAEDMLLINQEWIVGHAPQASSVSFVSFQVARPPMQR
jgi:hypothetical protein